MILTSKPVTQRASRCSTNVRVAQVFGASVFWIRPALLVLETLEEFIAQWQITRNQTRRGIVEVRA
jgi:hypothetical protein